MSLAKGSWTIFSTFYVENVDVSDVFVTCNLVAGSNTDTAAVTVAAEPGLDEETAALNVSHTATAAFVVNLQCSSSGAWQAISIKITAIKAGSLTNSPIT
jgi:hypothetical protein